MPIRKPVERTIRTDDFRDKAYSFVVESALGPEQTPGVVLLSASAGYLLTTSATSQPKREQVVRYDRQVDNSWVATATVTVTLVAADELPVDGTVVIHDSGGETAVLTVNTVSTSLKRLDTPLLTVSQPALTFIGASPDKPDFRVIAIAQRGSSEPVTLTTDAPAYFQLASDNHPAFSPSLTLTPSPVGTYVHIRYAASRYGSHTGQLLIQGITGQETVTLKGNNAGPFAFLSSVNQATLVKRSGELLALVLVTGLAYAGYSYRCQFFPALCQQETLNQTTNTVAPAPPASTRSVFTERKPASRETIPTTGTEATESSGWQFSGGEREPVERPAEQPVYKENVTITNNNVSSSSNAVSGSSDRRKKVVNRNTANTADERPRRRVKIPVPLTEESELERELNQNSQN
ncbi:hypothetical protein [Spirosoma arcticum]